MVAAHADGQEGWSLEPLRRRGTVMAKFMILGAAARRNNQSQQYGHARPLHR